MSRYTPRHRANLPRPSSRGSRKRQRRQPQAIGASPPVSFASWFSYRSLCLVYMFVLSIVRASNFGCGLLPLQAHLRSHCTALPIARTFKNWPEPVRPCFAPRRSQCRRPFRPPHHWSQCPQRLVKVIQWNTDRESSAKSDLVMNHRPAAYLPQPQIIAPNPLNRPRCKRLHQSVRQAPSIR